MIMFEAMLISAGGLWLGLFGLVVLGSLIWASESDSFILGSAVILISAVVAQFVFTIPVWATLIANPFLLILYIAVYIAVGAVYAGMWKLPNYVNKNSNGIQIDYKRWKENQDDWNRKGHDETRDVSYDTFLNSPYYEYSVKNNKDRVASWVLLWPVSLTWELMHKPFIWLWDSVYYGLGKVFEKINHDQAKKILENNSKK